MTALTNGLRAWALIDSAALRQNVKSIRSLVGRSAVYGVVKANGYGHTLEHVVGTLKDRLDGFAVATLEEGLFVRELAPSAAVMVLSEFNDPAQITVFRSGLLQPVIHRAEQVDWLECVAPLPTQIWLKVDSGMNRLGVPGSDAPGYCTRLTNAGHQVSIMSHMACADEATDNLTASQISRFTELSVGKTRSLANSAALLSFPEARLDMVRPGLLLYGVSPFHPYSEVSTLISLRPAMRLEARLIAVKPVSRGRRVGYGGTWVSKRDSVIGIVSFGYADGYPRSISEEAYAVVNGLRAPLAGRVSMDMLTLDLTDCGDVAEGGTVQLWGESVGVGQVAQWAGTIPYELLCRVAARVPRFLI